MQQIVLDHFVLSEELVKTCFLRPKFVYQINIHTIRGDSIEGMANGLNGKMLPLLSFYNNIYFSIHNLTSKNGLQ